MNIRTHSTRSQQYTYITHTGLRGWVSPGLTPHPQGYTVHIQGIRYPQDPLCAYAAPDPHTARMMALHDAGHWLGSIYWGFAQPTAPSL